MKELISAIILCLCITPVNAQTTVSEVIESYSEAIGGQTFRDINSIYFEQTATARGNESQEYIYKQKPDGYLKQTLSGKGNQVKNNGQMRLRAVKSANTSILFVDGKSYQKHAMTAGKYTELPAAYQATLLKDKDILPRLLRLYAKEGKDKFTYDGREKMAQQEVDVITYTANGSKESYYISTKTHLLLKRRETVVLNSAGQTAVIDVHYEDYRLTEGVQIPYKVVQKSAAGALFKTVDLKKVEINPEFEADLFKHR